MSAWPLLGVALVVLGLALRLNALLVVVVAGLVTGLLAGMTPLAVLTVFGASLLRNRFLLVFVLTLPVIGLLERNGLREHGQAWIARMRTVTSSRLLLAYLAMRQIFAMLGLTHIGGHAQTVRPLLAPMAESAAQQRHGELPPGTREKLLAFCAATDNVGLFFGEDVFIAFGAVLLMQGFLAENGILVEPLTIALWGLPTALAAFLIHGWRAMRREAWLAREVRGAAAQARTPAPQP